MAAAQKADSLMGFPDIKPPQVEQVLLPTHSLCIFSMPSKRGSGGFNVHATETLFP